MLRIYNTMTRTKEDLVTRQQDVVFMYVCGPTVYNDIHIGNARTFLSFDVIRRYLEYRGYLIRYCQNITDVDDKIIRAANEEGVTPAEIAERYTEAFLKAMDGLGIKKPTFQPRATEMIPEMVAMVERLIERGHAYAVGGDVYFSVRSFPGYGQLSGRDINDLESGARVQVDARKKDPLDFALWKAAKPGEPQWPSPWGEGRPGWHLECSVMSEKELGLPLDIHGGATDLIFPHHENERAQAEAASDQVFSKYWVHGGLLQVDAEKMSKSLGNFTLLKDVLASYPAPVVRVLMLQTHYRSPLDFSPERLEEAKTAFERVANVVRNLRWLKSVSPAGPGAPMVDRGVLAGAIADTRSKFEAEMDDDFNTAGGLGAIFALARDTNTYLGAYEGVLSREDHLILERTGLELVELLSVLGITVPEVEAPEEYPFEIVQLAVDLAGYEGSEPREAVDALLAARDAARSEKNFAAADTVRDALVSLGFAIEDTPSGARVHYER